MNNIGVGKVFLFVVVLGAGLLSPDVFAGAVSADGTSSGSSESAYSGFIEFLEQLLSIGYIILWPLFFLAGILSDNTLVYGSGFNLDMYLWNLWNIMKNFANFIIGFVFILAVFLYIFNYKQDKFSPKKFFPKLLIAGVGVQASWFLVAILIDISTILTYAVGGLPLSSVQGNEQLDQKTMVIRSNMDIDNIGSIFSGTGSSYVWYSDGDKEYVPCKMSNTVTHKIEEGDTLSAIIHEYYDTSGWTDIEERVRDVAGQNGLDDPDKVGIGQEVDLTLDDATGKIYVGSDDLRERIEEDMQGHQLNGTEIEFENNSCVMHDMGYLVVENPQIGDSREEMIDNSEKQGINLSQLLDGAAGTSGIFSSVFSTFLNFSSLSMSQQGLDGDQNLGNFSLLMLFQFLFALAFIAPLVAFVVILFVRIFVLWMLIVFSPLLTIMWSFDFNFGENSGKYSVGAFLWIIFLPVVVVFVLSIGALFLTAINTSLLNNEGNNPINGLMSLQGQENEEDGVCEDGENAWKLDMFEDKPIHICFAEVEFDGGVAINAFFDYFSWFLANFFGIMVMWMVLFAVLKSGKFTGGIGNYIYNFSNQLAQTAPVVPSPYGTHSLGELEKFGSMIERAPRHWKEQQYTQGALRDFANKTSSSISGALGGERRYNSRQISGFAASQGGDDVGADFHELGNFITNEGLNLYEYKDDILSVINSHKDSWNFSTLDAALTDPEVVAEFSKQGHNIEGILENSKSQGDNESSRILNGLKDELERGRYDSKIDGAGVYTRDGVAFHFTGNGSDISLSTYDYKNNLEDLRSLASVAKDVGGDPISLLGETVSIGGMDYQIRDDGSVGRIDPSGT
ncbi:LysM peptidoglycan-binding domain-containing protein [Candidatus Absconditicoccus praedator]|uniref:LysM peptidoglycan-binding domain-containing protein n=1 Tax=Candidatus Absconditicoccus praedator TaxID=2735562 RepID=UPI001E5964FC|nr:LysM domain-containing protein [Candidatus Absconditicoccus praedator]UFX82838.1 hypothetical protein HLG78_01735 [Candidatus Absconditicoccus praedator]